MPSHLIRFRKAWDCQDIGTPGASAGRRNLPLADNRGDPLPARARISRTFGCPPLLWGRETLVIRLERVPGLRTLRLNDRLMPLPDPLPEMFEISLDAPLVRNRLVLEVDFDPLPPNDSATREGWGMIALVINRDEGKDR